MLIQEFCRVTGLGRDTVRFYVRKGLLTPSIGTPARNGMRANRYRVFDAAQVERARLIRAAQKLGFTLREIAALAAEYEGSGLTDQGKVEVLRAHLRGLDLRAAQLDAIRGYVAAKIAWLEQGARGDAPRLAPEPPAGTGEPPRVRTAAFPPATSPAPG